MGEGRAPAAPLRKVFGAAVQGMSISPLLAAIFPFHSGRVISYRVRGYVLNMIEGEVPG